MTRHPQQGLSRYPMLPPPVYVVEHPSLLTYWREVLSPPLTSVSDDGLLASLILTQIEAWEANGDSTARQAQSVERDYNYRHALHVLTLLTDTLNMVRRRIHARIATAEAVLAGAA